MRDGEPRGSGAVLISVGKRRGVIASISHTLSSTSRNPGTHVRSGLCSWAGPCRVLQGVLLGCM